MEALNLDINHFAEIMANALAVLHWEVKIDAADVEFVLGSAPTETHHRAPTFEQLKKMKPDSSTYSIGSGLTFYARVVHLWLLDFNRCKEIDMNEVGVDAAVEAFVLNDRYYPRPSVHKKLWDLFSKQYLRTSARIIGEAEYLELPSKFIEKVVPAMSTRAGRMV